MTESVAVLGLGAMGLPMASRLATRFRVVGFDPGPDRAAEAQTRGIAVAASARDAASQATCALLAVRTPEQLSDALFGPDAIGCALTPGSAVILTSTVGIDAARDAERRLAERGVGLVDAPVSGGPGRAADGELLIAVGARPEALAVARPVLDALAGTLTVVGDEAGRGQALKTVNQLLCGVHIAAAAEALALAQRLGLDPERALPALQAGAAQSFMLGDRGPRMVRALAGEDAEVRSRLDIFVKDLGIVAQAAQDATLATPVAAAAQQQFLLGVARGLAAGDDSSVIRVLGAEA